MGILLVETRRREETAATAVLKGKRNIILSQTSRGPLLVYGLITHCPLYYTHKSLKLNKIKKNQILSTIKFLLCPSLVCLYTIVVIRRFVTITKQIYIYIKLQYILMGFNFQEYFTRFKA